MKTLLVIILGLMITAGQSFAAYGNEPAAPISAVEVGNKICPVSGEEVGKMGPVATVEYNCKIYNLCCPMCEKDFKKDPESFIKKIEESMGVADAEAAPETGHEGHEHGK